MTRHRGDDTGFKTLLPQFTDNRELVERFFNEVARDVIDPQKGVSVAERLRARSEAAQVPVSMLIKTFSTTFLPLNCSKVTSAISVPVSLKSGACAENALLL